MTAPLSGVLCMAGAKCAVSLCGVRDGLVGAVEGFCFECGLVRVSSAREPVQSTVAEVGAVVRSGVRVLSLKLKRRGW